MRPSETEFELAWVLDHAPAVVSRLSERAEILYISGGARELYGREPDELVGTSAFDLVANPDERADSLRRLDGLDRNRG